MFSLSRTRDLLFTSLLFSLPILQFTTILYLSLSVFMASKSSNRAREETLLVGTWGVEEGKIKRGPPSINCEVDKL